MCSAPVSAQYLEMLNEALARELQVSLQYMLQHSVSAGLKLADPVRAALDTRANFIGTHAPYFLPGWRLKKIAITEMRHAEAISERIVVMGGTPTVQPHPISMGATSVEMLQEDRKAEQEAISLYTEIVAAAEAGQDRTTAQLFRRILLDERRHLDAFSKVLA